MFSNTICKYYTACSIDNSNYFSRMQTVPDQTGSALCTVGGGTSPYNYTWNTNPPQNTSSISNLTAGTYTVNVTDNHNCRISASVEIRYFAGFSATMKYNTGKLSCGWRNCKCTNNRWQRWLLLFMDSCSEYRRKRDRFIFRSIFSYGNR